MAKFPDLSILSPLNSAELQRDLNTFFREAWTEQALSGEPEVVYLTAFNAQGAPDDFRVMRMKIARNLALLSLRIPELDERLYPFAGGMDDGDDDQVRSDYAIGAVPANALLSPIDGRVLLSPLDGRILLRAA